MNGYQLITQIAERSGGAWKPSPGSVYPTIQQLEDEGLIEADEARPPTSGSPTRAAGTSRRTPTSSRSRGSRSERPARRSRRRRLLQPQAGDRPGDERGLADHHHRHRPQQREAIDVLIETRRKLYGLLAEGDDAPRTRWSKARRTTTTVPTGVSGDGRASQGRPRELRISDAERERPPTRSASTTRRAGSPPRSTRAPRPDLGRKTRAELTPIFPTCRAAPTSARRRTRPPTAPASARTGRAAAARTPRRRWSATVRASAVLRQPAGPCLVRPLPVLIKILLAAALVVLVVAHLPLILVGLLVWAVLAYRGGACRPSRDHQRRW